MTIDEIKKKLDICAGMIKSYDSIINEKGSFVIRNTEIFGEFIVVMNDERFYNEIKGYAIREKAKVVAQIKYLSDKLKEYEKLVNGK